MSTVLGTLRVTAGPQCGESFAITGATTRIGRNPQNNDIVLTDPAVSRTHIVLTRQGGHWVLSNASQTNPVLVDGREQLYTHLQDSATIKLGSTTLHWTREPAGDAAGSQAPSRGGEQHAAPPVGPPEWGGRAAVERRVWHMSGAHQPVPSTSGIPGQTAGQCAAAALPPRPGSDTILGFDASKGGVTMQFALADGRGGQSKGKRVALVIGAAALLGICGLCSAGLTLMDLFPIVQRLGIGYGFIAALLVLLIPIAPAVGVFLLTNFIDRFEVDPWFLRIGAFLWGAVIAIPPAFVINTLALSVAQRLGTVAELAFFWTDPGIVEESCKGLGLLLLFLVIRDQFDDVLDGLVFAALIGAGFAMTENFGYLSRAVVSGGFAGLLVNVFIRVVIGWLGHATFTAFIGAGIGIFRTTNKRWLKIVAPLAGYIAAISLHNTFDGLLTLFGVLHINGLVGIIVVNLMLIFAQMLLFALVIATVRQESRVIAAIMVPELQAGIITSEEYAVLPRSFKRTAAERKVLFRYGWRAYRLVKELYQTEIGLAFRKWHVSLGDKAKTGRRQPEDAYRLRIFYLRGQLRQEIARKSAPVPSQKFPVYAR